VTFFPFHLLSDSYIFNVPVHFVVYYLPFWVRLATVIASGFFINIDIEKNSFLLEFGLKKDNAD
jgi:hypothetical protein